MTMKNVIKEMETIAKRKGLEEPHPWVWYGTACRGRGGCVSEAEFSPPIFPGNARV